MFIFAGIRSPRQPGAVYPPAIDMLLADHLEEVGLAVLIACQISLTIVTGLVAATLSRLLWRIERVRTH